MATPAYYYSSTAGSYTLTGAVTSSATSITLNSVTGLPSNTPYKMVLDPGGTAEEIVKVTAIAGTTLTVTRGWDGSSATSHTAGATARHMMTAEDLTLSRNHEAATAAHGVTGNVVGTTDTQTLTNKTLDGGSNTVTNIPGSAVANTAWTAYTPTLTAATTNPVLGTGGSATGRSMQIGKTVYCQGNITFGTSGQSFGSGNWVVTLPVNANNAGLDDLGLVAVYPGTTGHAVGWAVRVSGNQFQIYVAAASGQLTTAYAGGNVLGVAPAAGFTLRWNFTYEAA